MLKVIAPLSVVFALTVGTVSCTTTSTAPSDPHLAGRWQLDQPSSDDADAKISAAIDEAESKLRKKLANAGFTQYEQPDSSRRGRGGGGGAPPSGGLNGEEYSQTGYIGPDFNELRRNLLRVLGSPHSLTIDVNPDYVRLAGDDTPPRDYPPDDEFIRMDEYGTARIDTSWSGSTFRLRARYQNKATVTESYTADEHTGTLTVVRYLVDPVAGNLTVRAVYRR